MHGWSRSAASELVELVELVSMPTAKVANGGQQQW